MARNLFEIVQWRIYNNFLVQLKLYQILMAFNIIYVFVIIYSIVFIFMNCNGESKHLSYLCIFFNNLFKLMYKLCVFCTLLFNYCTDMVIWILFQVYFVLFIPFLHDKSFLTRLIEYTKKQSWDINKFSKKTSKTVQLEINGSAQIHMTVHPYLWTKITTLNQLFSLAI